MITNAHFGGNIVLTRDTANVSGPYEKMLNEISFSSFRYPGGSVTEEQTWKNGGLDRMFGSPMSHESDNYVMTIREALQLSIDHDASMTIVVPTFQFWNAENKTFDKSGFNKYLGELEKALTEYPAAKIEAFEIGNEYWAEISAADYGAIASHEIMALHKFDAAMSAKLGSRWEDVDIGVQAGASWRGTGVPESTTIAKAISADARPLVSKIYQHGYPNAAKDATGSIDHSLKTMKAFSEVPGFSRDLELSLSEFNMHAGGPMGTDQAGHWIESFAQYVQGGVDEIYMWGTQYEWLSSKMYDALPHRGESADVIATPMGQIYDLASNYLVGKSVIADDTAVRDIELPAQINVTGFEGGGQRVVFLHNRGNKATVDLSNIDSNAHVTIHHMTPADSPLTQRNDESDRSARPGPVDARGDMSVRSGAAISDELGLASGDVATIIISDPRLGLVLEGAHNVTDARTGLVDDHIIGGMGNDIIRGHVGDDNLGGAGGNDVITGGQGDDRIAGGNGNDVLISDHGSDSLSGGAGDDLILIDQANALETTSVVLGDGRDVILTTGNQNVDIADFTSSDAIGLGGVFENQRDLNKSLTVDREDLVMKLPNGQEVRFIGGAGLKDQMATLVIDFQSDQQVDDSLDHAFSGLADQQIVEIYDQVPELGHSMVNVENWQNLEDVLAQHDSALSEPALSPGPNPHPDPASLEKPEAPIPASPYDNPPYSPYDDDNYVPDHSVEDPQDYNSGSGGSCFVATAAFGDRMHPDVVALRLFRDHHLVRTAMGRSFVRLYWIVGPRLAAVTKPHQLHAAVFRQLLTGAVIVLHSLGKTGPSR